MVETNHPQVYLLQNKLRPKYSSSVFDVLGIVLRLAYQVLGNKTVREQVFARTAYPEDSPGGSPGGLKGSRYGLAADG